MSKTISYDVVKVNNKGSGEAPEDQAGLTGTAKVITGVEKLKVSIWMDWSHP